MPTDRPRIDELPELATAEMVAQTLYCSPNFVRQRCEAGEIQATKIAGRWLIDGPDAVRAYVEKCRCPRKTPAPPSSGEKSGRSGKSCGSNEVDAAANRRLLQTVEKHRKSLQTSSSGRSRPARVIPLNAG